MKRILFFMVCAVCACRAERASFDEGWKFFLGDPSGAEQVEFGDTNWRALDVPHDWSIEGDYSKSNPMGGTCGYLPAG